MAAQACCAVAHPVDHPCGTADIEMRAERLCRQQPVEIDALVQVVMVEPDAPVVTLLQHVGIVPSEAVRQV